MTAREQYALLRLAWVELNRIPGVFKSHLALKQLAVIREVMLDVYGQLSEDEKRSMIGKESAELVGPKAGG